MASEELIKLNIGGKVFQTTRSTLTKYDGYFRGILDSGIPLTLDEAGCIFIDRSPKQFGIILNFLRDDRTPLPESEFEREQLLQEANYYMLEILIHECGGVPSEAWMVANVDTLYLRKWRIAGNNCEVIFTSDIAEYRDFSSFCQGKFCLLINYNPKFWGDIHGNSHVQKFRNKFRNIPNILFYCCFDNPKPMCFIQPPWKSSIVFFGTAHWTAMTVKELLEQVEKKLDEHL